MKNTTENPNSISNLLKCKTESFQIEELDARLEMHPWTEGGTYPPFPGPWPDFACWPIPDSDVPCG